MEDATGQGGPHCFLWKYPYGIGAVIAGGCNLGHGVTGMSTMSLSSLVAIIAIMLAIGLWSISSLYGRRNKKYLSLSGATFFMARRWPFFCKRDQPVTNKGSVAAEMTIVESVIFCNFETGTLKAAVRPWSSPEPCAVSNQYTLRSRDSVSVSSVVAGILNDTENDMPPGPMLISSMRTFFPDSQRTVSAMLWKDF